MLKIVKANEKRFVDVFNTAGPLNIREHALELLPGIGKKHLEAILKARNEKKFESFADIAARIPQLQDPSRPIKERIIAELQGRRALLHVHQALPQDPRKVLICSAAKGYHLPKLERLEERVLLGLTGENADEVLSKLDDAEALGTKRAALFLEMLSPDEKKRVYARLEDTTIKEIPQVHLRHDMLHYELDFLERHMKTRYLTVE